MKRLQYYRYGGPEELYLEDFELGTPGEGQILVRVKAASVNPIDYRVRRGDAKFLTGRQFPRAMGTDFSGVVEAVGPGVERLKVGYAVLGTLPVKKSGTFAERLIAEEKHTVRKPPKLSFEQAATLPTVGVIAWSALVEKAKLKPGQSVFVHGCLGGVGRMAVQIAQMIGAEVAGSCRGSAIAGARELGIDPLVDFDHLNFAALKHRFDVVFDTAGTLMFEDGRKLINSTGVVLDIHPSLPKRFVSLTSAQFSLVSASKSEIILATVAEAAADAKIRLPIGRIAHLSVAIQAIRELEESGIPKGKLVIVAS